MESATLKLGGGAGGNDSSAAVGRLLDIFYIAVTGKLFGNRRMRSLRDRDYAQSGANPSGDTQIRPYVDTKNPANERAAKRGPVPDRFGSELTF